MYSSRKYIAPSIEVEDEFTTMMVVSTKSDESHNPACDRKLDLRDMDEKAVKSLQKTDPFMYYSIPGVLDATLNHREVDYTDIMPPRNSDSHRSRHPQSGEEDDDVDASKVTRRTRVSVESHPSLIFDKLFADLEHEFGGHYIDLEDLVSKFGNK